MPINDNELSSYRSRIVLGEKAKQILGGEVGRYIITKAQEEVDAVVEFLQSVDPTDVKSIITLQVKLNAALAVPQWLNQAIDEAEIALSEYMDRKEIDKQEQEGGF